MGCPARGMAPAQASAEAAVRLRPHSQNGLALLGLAWRFAFALSASAAGALAHYRLRVTPSKVILEVPARREAIAGEPVQKRLGELADALGRKGEILVG